MNWLQQKLSVAEQQSLLVAYKLALKVERSLYPRFSCVSRSPEQLLVKQLALCPYSIGL